MSNMISRAEARAQTLNKYFTGKPCKHGHVTQRLTSTGQCLGCLSARNADPIYKEFKAKLSATPEYKEARRQYALSEEGKAGYKRRQSTPEYRARDSARRRERYANDPQYRLKILLRTRLNLHLKGKSYTGQTALTLLGCSLEEFRAYFEAHPNWQAEWSWSDLGVLFHIDHIKALGLFDLTDPHQETLAAHYTNLQPLSTADHYIKTKADIRLILESSV